MTLRLRPEAEADIENIALHIAEDNPAAARHWFDDIYRRCRILDGMPGTGVSRSDIRPDLRMHPAGNYLILYREIEGGAEIVRIIRGARQWQEFL